MELLIKKCVNLLQCSLIFEKVRSSIYLLNDTDLSIGDRSDRE